MLHPHERRTLIGALRPPGGYRLVEAIATSYTLDLLTLLTTPLAFTLFEHEADGDTPDPLAILQAIREYAGRIGVFCQAGRIRVPAQQRPLFGYLEGSVHEVSAPDPHGVFHPKVWLLSFEAEGLPPRVRFLCGSRNLTFDRSWDTLLVLDGEVLGSDDDRNAPLADFVEALPGLCLHGASAELRARCGRLARLARRTRFEPPEHIEEIRFWPLGIGQGDPFATRVDRMLVISPFLSRSRLARLPGRDNILISRPEELDGCLVPENFGDLYTLHESAEPERDDSAGEREEDSAPLHGLHAKLFVGDAGWNANLWTGSANATVNAFERNVEFLVQLGGRKSRIGIGVILGTDDGGGLRSLLEPYTPPADPASDDAPSATAILENAWRHLLAAGLSASVQAEAEGGGYRLTLIGDRGPELPAGVRIRCRPISLHPNRELPLQLDRTELALFAGVSLLSLTGFFAFDIALGDERIGFTLNLPLTGAPDERLDGVLAELLRDRDSVMRFLLMLLADPDDPAGDTLALVRALSRGASDGGQTRIEIPLLETMLRALRSDPGRLDPVGRLIADLRRQNAELLPEGLERIWDAIRAAREGAP